MLWGFLKQHQIAGLQEHNTTFYYHKKKILQYSKHNSENYIKSDLFVNILEDLYSFIYVNNMQNHASVSPCNENCFA